MGASKSSTKKPLAKTKIPSWSQTSNLLSHSKKSQELRSGNCNSKLAQNIERKLNMPISRSKLSPGISPKESKILSPTTKNISPTYKNILKAVVDKSNRIVSKEKLDARENVFFGSNPKSKGLLPRSTPKGVMDKPGKA